MKAILKKVCKWLVYFVVFILVMIALVSIKEDNQRKTEVIKSDPIHVMNDDVLRHHKGDTLYVSYDSREYDDYKIDKIIKDMNSRGYKVINKYVERLQYQDMNYDFIYIREYTVTHIIYRK
jgi:hypothetical protein